MAKHTFTISILLVLAFLVGGNVVLFLSFGDETSFSLLLVEETDSDDSKESESKLVATIAPSTGLRNLTQVHSVSDEVNHQIEWLFVHEHAARAPPLG